MRTWVTDMKEMFRYEVVVKDVFQRDKPSIIGRITGGKEPAQFLNPEFAAVEARTADLLILHPDEWMTHIDFQSTNDPEMAHRMGIYGLMASQKYGRRKIRQVVLYVGHAAMNMADDLDVGEIQVRYRLMDIRELEAADLLKSQQPGDWALAMLARNGTEKLREILKKANGLKGPARQRLLTQLAVLSGLRRVSERLTMELKSMGVELEIDQNVFLRDIRDAALAQGRAEGKAEGMVVILRDLLRKKFGRLPKWADQRLERATPAQAEQWAKKVLTGATLEDILGKR